MSHAENNCIFLNIFYLITFQEISRLEAEKRHLVEILSLHEPTCVKRSRLEHEDDNFRVPAVPPPRGGPPRLSRQDSFLQTLEILGSLDEITQYSTDSNHTNNQSNGPKSDQDNYQDCSFSASKPNYFLVNKPQSLSNNGFQNEHRCTLALWYLEALKQIFNLIYYWKKSTQAVAVL